MISRTTIGGLALLFAWITAAAAVAGDEAVSLRIRSSASVSGGKVSLGDVLLIPTEATDLGARIIEAPALSRPRGFADSQTSAALPRQITYEQIEARLAELGVDLSRVLLSGAAVCRIEFAAPSPHSATDGLTPLVRDLPAGLGGGLSLAELLQAHLEKDLAPLNGTPDVQFEQASRDYLELTSPPFEFNIRANDRQKLGLREFRVVIRRDDRTERVANIFGRVRLTKSVLQARRPLNVGSYVDRDALELQPRLFEREDDLGLDTIDEAVGQRVAKFIPAGQMITRPDLKQVEMVRRSRPVTVLSETNTVTVRTSGVAMDDGGFGDVIRVRMGDARRNRAVLRAVVTGVGMVRVTEDG